MSKSHVSAPPPPSVRDDPVDGGVVGETSSTRIGGRVRLVDRGPRVGLDVVVPQARGIARCPRRRRGRRPGRRPRDATSVGATPLLGPGVGLEVVGPHLPGSPSRSRSSRRSRRRRRAGQCEARRLPVGMHPGPGVRAHVERPRLEARPSPVLVTATSLPARRSNAIVPELSEVGRAWSTGPGSSGVDPGGHSYSWPTGGTTAGSFRSGCEPTRSAPPTSAASRAAPRSSTQARRGMATKRHGPKVVVPWG